jgi:hypothetical protein
MQREESCASIRGCRSGCLALRCSTFALEHTSSISYRDDNDTQFEVLRRDARTGRAAAANTGGGA